MDRPGDRSRVDRRPKSTEVEQVARGDEGSGDLGEVDPELLGELEWQGQPAAIDQLVRQLGRDQLAPQPVVVDRGSESAPASPAGTRRGGRGRAARSVTSGLMTSAS